MGDQLDNWLEDVLSDGITISLADINAEARANCWSFTLSSVEAESISTTKLRTFITAVIAARAGELRNRGVPAGASRFYCWFDSQAIQLRFSIVSTVHGILPFGAATTAEHDLDHVLESFRSSRFHDGIPWSELASDDRQIPADNSTTDTLKVWSVFIP